MIAQAPQQAPVFESPVSFHERLLERERDLVGMLDWPQAQIAMVCDSRLERDMRLGACAKEPETVEWLERVVRPESVFYDVGACSGSYSLIAAALRAQVMAFEPSSNNHRQLVRNAALNRLPVNAFPVALGKERKVTGMVLSSMAPGAASHSLTDGMFTEGQIGQVVMLYPLDDFVRDFAIDLPYAMKIDTDGNELDVLLGAAEVLRTVRHLMIEVSVKTAAEAERLCVEAGLERINSTRRIEPTQANVEYVRR